MIYKKEKGKKKKEKERKQERKKESKRGRKEERKKRGEGGSQGEGRKGERPNASGKFDSSFHLKNVSTFPSALTKELPDTSQCQCFICPHYMDVGNSLYAPIS